MDKFTREGDRPRIALLPLPVLVLLIVLGRPVEAQVRSNEPKGPTQKIARKESLRERNVPAPEVVNSESLPRNAPDPLDGPPFVTSRVWAVADGRTGSVLWGHHEAEVVEMASTTKIMTALVVVRLMTSDPTARSEFVTFSRRADRTEGSSSDVREGERLPVHELLYGMMLPSGNDAAVAFAEHFGGRLKPPADAPDQADPFPRFIAEMNRVAAELGLHETHFANPNGLPALGHRSSARDLAKLASHALAQPVFATVVSTRKHGCTLVNTKGQSRNVVWTNTNHLLDTEGYDGVKTGTTRAAGTCLVASGRRGKDHLIVVILGGSNRRTVAILTLGTSSAGPGKCAATERPALRRAVEKRARSSSAVEQGRLDAFDSDDRRTTGEILADVRGRAAFPNRPIGEQGHLALQQPGLLQRGRGDHLMRQEWHRDRPEYRAELIAVRTRDHGKLPRRAEQEVERDQALTGRRRLAFQQELDRFQCGTTDLGEFIATGQGT